MGFFDSLFGGGKKPTPKKKKAAATLEIVQTPVVVAGLSPKVIAVIAASVNLALGDEADAAIIAAVTAAIIHAGKNGVMAVEIKRSGNVWAETGRQKIMDARL